MSPNGIIKRLVGFLGNLESVEDRFVFAILNQTMLGMNTRKSLPESRCALPPFTQSNMTLSQEIIQSSSTTYQHSVEVDTFPALQVAKAIIKEQLEKQEFDWKSSLFISLPSCIPSDSVCKKILVLNQNN